MTHINYIPTYRKTSSCPDLKQACFPFSLTLQFAPETSHSIGNTGFSSSNLFQKILLAAECSSFRKVDLGQPWEKNLGNQVWQMKKPFENYLSSSSNNVCLVKGKFNITLHYVQEARVSVHSERTLNLLAWWSGSWSLHNYRKNQSSGLQLWPFILSQGIWLPIPWTQAKRIYNDHKMMHKAYTCSSWHWLGAFLMELTNHSSGKEIKIR